MANTEYGFLVSILRAPGALMGTVASPAWEKKAYATGYHTTYGSLEAAKDFSLDNVNKEIFVLRKEDKKGEGDFYEAVSFVKIQEFIKQGKIQKDDFVLLDVRQEVPARAEKALAEFGFDWQLEKKDPQGSELIEEFKKLLATAAPAVAPAVAPEMQQMMVQMKEMQQQMLQLKQQNIKLEKQAEDLLAEKEVKKANPIK